MSKIDPLVFGVETILFNKHLGVVMVDPGTLRSLSKGNRLPLIVKQVRCVSFLCGLMSHTI